MGHHLEFFFYDPEMGLFIVEKTEIKISAFISKYASPFRKKCIFVWNSKVPFTIHKLVYFPSCLYNSLHFENKCISMALKRAFFLHTHSSISPFIFKSAAFQTPKSRRLASSSLCRLSRSALAAAIKSYAMHWRTAAR